MSSGMKYGKAIEIDDKKEGKERSKSKFYKEDIKLKRKHDPKLIESIHKRKIVNLGKKINVWIVNGEVVRDLFFIDFTEGGHDKVYSFVPKNEIWIDDDVSPNERKFVMVHEIHERNLMSKGFNYDKAHLSASAIEYKCRKKPSLVQKIIKQEIKRSLQ